MAHPHLLFLFLFLFMFLCNLQSTSSSTCTLDFKQFPFEVQSECFEATIESNPSQAMISCCHLALLPIFQAMTIRANMSQSIFLDPTQAKDCSTMFQVLHNRTDLSNCKIQDFITTSSTNACSRNVDSVMDILGMERYNGLRSSCGNLSKVNYNDDACFNCVASYRTSLQALQEGDGGKRDGSSDRMCAEALLVSLASTDVRSMDWVQGIFSCLWDEIEFQGPAPKHRKGFLFGSKKLLATILIAISFVILAPILYKVTRRRLQYASEKEIENLSVIVLTKALEDNSTNPFSCSGIYIFSQDEISKATNSFNNSNLIGEGSLGKMYLGIMPSGMRVAIKRINKGLKLLDFVGEISKKAKIRHPNLVSILGYCDRGEQCLVYEYCNNGDLSKWLLAGPKAILTWERRLKIAFDVARGLWFLQNNSFEKLVHGNIKLTNILLNEELEAKISDFVLSHLKSRETKGLGIVENDVFNYGVVLLQLLTGRKIVDSNSSATRSLVNEARNIVAKGGNVCALVDPHLNGAYDSIAFQRILTLAILCTNPIDRERPSMEEILKELRL